MQALEIAPDNLKAVETIKGLDIRANYAIAKINLTIFSEAEHAVDQLFDVYLEAVNLGFHDFNCGLNFSPCMFRDAPILMDWWKEGFKDAKRSREISECSGCQDAHGDPCYTHG